MCHKNCWCYNARKEKSIYQRKIFMPYCHSICDVLMSCSNIKNLVGSDSHAISTRGHRHIEFSVSLFSKPLKCKSS